MNRTTKSFQGEVNETNEAERGNLTDARTAPLILRGSNVCTYAVREASQGEDVRLNVKKFLAGKEEDSKAFAHERDRVGFQRSSPQNNFRRIIACRISKGSFCFDTVSYVTDESSEIDLDLLVAFLDSRILDWYFDSEAQIQRLTSISTMRCPSRRSPEPLLTFIGIRLLKDVTGRN